MPGRKKMKIDQKDFDRPDEQEAALAPRDKRHSTFLHGQIWSINGSGWRDAIFRNLSRNGMKINCEKAWVIGSPIICKLRGIGEVTATVTWVKGNSVGVRFDKVIDPKAVWQAAQEPAESESLARFLHRKPGTFSRPAITLPSRSSKNRSDRGNGSETG